MAESTLTLNRWTPTRKAAVIVELLRGGDAVELARTHGLRAKPNCSPGGTGSCKPARRHKSR
ncbi:MAG TPA: hypothetical protein VN494_08055 [Patescibacteria group bacterium]|nr:hypothetical protein [Patescibacteria group bacterium]